MEVVIVFIINFYLFISPPQVYIPWLPVRALLAPVHILLRRCDGGQHRTTARNGKFHNSQRLTSFTENNNHTLGGLNGSHPLNLYPTRLNVPLRGRVAFPFALRLRPGLKLFLKQTKDQLHSSAACQDDSPGVNTWRRQLLAFRYLQSHPRLLKRY